MEATSLNQHIHDDINFTSIMEHQTSTPIAILTMGLSKHLHGDPIANVLNDDWTTKVDSSTRARFDNVGFDINPLDVQQTLQDLRQTLRNRSWDGITIGWCTRGYPERTELFEQIVDLCVDETHSSEVGDANGGRRKTKLMFSTGPDNLAATAMRNFPST
jgi:hypothetical protein